MKKIRLTKMFAMACGALITTVALTGCDATKTTTVSGGAVTSSKPVQQMKRSEVIRNISGDWAVMEVEGSNVTDVTAETYPYLTLSPNELNPASAVDFCAFNGCNIINGTFILNGNQVQKGGDYASTMRLCPDAKYEMAMANALEQMSQIKLERFNNEWFMYLQNSDGQNLMVLRKHNLNFLDGAWRITKINGDNVPKSAGIQMVIDLANYKIHGNAGCNILNGTISVNMEVENGVKFGNLGTTRMMCPNIDLEQKFLQALTETVTAVPTDNNKTTLLRNDRGQTIIEMTRMSRSDLRE